MSIRYTRKEIVSAFYKANNQKEKEAVLVLEHMLKRMDMRKEKFLHTNADEMFPREIEVMAEFGEVNTVTV